MVEVAGFPQLGGPSPVLQEAVVRSQGAAELPQPRPLDPTNLLAVANDSTRVRVSALLVNVLAGTGRSTLLEMQLGRTPFLARAGFPADLLSKLRPGSQLELTGVYAGEGSGRRIDAFEILLDSPMSVRVLAQPPWLTLRRLLTALGLLLIGLAGTMLWVLLLRRRVEVQTRIIREKVEREATLEERTRIARELHDTLEQALAGLNFQLGALAGCLRGMSGEAQQTLERARSMARHGQEEARRTVRNLRMLELEQGNLPAALSQLAHDAANGVPIHIETVVHGTPQPLSAQVESHLLRIGQEALTNALKHAGAHSIRFELRYDPASVELRVTDDGCGFEVAGTAPTEAGHFGLLGMRERANKMGGVFSIHSQPGQGTTITVRVPRNKHAPPQTVSA
jgi:signal transduction histidine kinase